MSMLDEAAVNQLRLVLLKNGSVRSYDDLLTLKSFVSKLEFIKQSLSGLHPKQMDDLCRNLTVESFANGDVVFKQGDIGDKLYFVLTGACEVVLRHMVNLAHGESEMREKVLFKCIQGQHFGERALISDEPRGASIVCVAGTDLIVLNKFTFVSLLKSAQADTDSEAIMTDQPGTKAFVLKILSKKKQMRTALEIESVAAYLSFRIPFFKKFTTEQLLELCRVAEAVSIWGKTTLFKQGSYGQAFYVVITGSVEIWVNTPEAMAAQAASIAAGNSQSFSSSSGNGHPAEQGMGIKVSTLVVGDTFGERALENADSLRMASVLTCDLLTDLLVISREDYHSLVSALMHEDTMAKITLLRKTDIFRDVDAIHLNELARFMEPKRFEVDDVLFRSGTKAVEMIILDRGECRVEVEVETYTDATATSSRTHTAIMAAQIGRRRTIEICRIAPCSVLATYITQAEALRDDVYHPETVSASTLLTAYTVGKHDLYTHLNRGTYKFIVQLIKDYNKPKIPYLWDSAPKIMGEKEWQRQQAWDSFKADVMNKRKTQSYVECLRSMTNIHLTMDSGNDHQGKHGADLVMLSPEVQRTAYVDQGWHDAPKEVGLDWGLPKSDLKTHYDSGILDRLSGTPSLVLKALAAEEDRNKKRATAKMKAFEDRGTGSRSIQSLSSAAAAGVGKKDSTKRLAFALVHVHREPVRVRGDGTGIRRLVRCHIRFCGTMRSCANAKEAAEEQMKNCLLNFFDSNHDRAEELRLKWKTYTGFESMPLQNTDIMLVYCRSVPVEYACISPSKDLLMYPFPAACKPRGQHFACVIMRTIAAPQNQTNQTETDVRTPQLSDPTANATTTTTTSSTPNRQRRRRRHPDDSDDDDEEPMTAQAEEAMAFAGLPAKSAAKRQAVWKQLAQPLFIQELAATVEVTATACTEVECLRFMKYAEAAARDRETNLAEILASSSSITDLHSEASILATIGGTSVTSVGPASLNVETATGSSNIGINNTTNVCVFPLFEWHVLSNDVIQAFSLNKFGTVTGVSLSPARWTRGSSYNVSGERGMTVALTEAGMFQDAKNRGKKAGTSSKSSGVITPLVTMKMLEREVSRKELSKEVHRHWIGMAAAQQSTEKTRKGLRKSASGSKSTGSKSVIGQGSLALGSERSVASIDSGLAPAQELIGDVQREERMKAMTAIIQARGKILQLNDDLCRDEEVFNSSTHQFGRDKDGNIKATHHTDSSDSENENEGEGNPSYGASMQQQGGGAGGQRSKPHRHRHRHRGPSALQGNAVDGGAGMGLLTDRMELFDALHALPATRSVVELSLRVNANGARGKGAANKTVTATNVGSGGELQLPHAGGLEHATQSDSLLRGDNASVNMSVVSGGDSIAGAGPGQRQGSQTGYPQLIQMNGFAKCKQSMLPVKLDVLSDLLGRVKESAAGVNATTV